MPTSSNAGHGSGLPAPRMKLDVSAICFGTTSLSSMPDTYGYEVGEERARETVRAIFDSSVNFLDTRVSMVSAVARSASGT